MLPIKDLYDAGKDYEYADGSILHIADYKKFTLEHGYHPEEGLLIKNPNGDIVGTITNKSFEAMCALSDNNDKMIKTTKRYTFEENGDIITITKMKSSKYYKMTKKQFNHLFADMSHFVSNDAYDYVVHNSRQWKNLNIALDWILLIISIVGLLTCVLCMV